MKFSYRFVNVVLLLLAVGSVFAGKHELVRGGKAEYAITCPPNSSEPVKLAAAELARYIEALSGAKPDVRTDGESGKKTILVCEASHGEKVWSEKMKPEEYRIISETDRIIIVGQRGRSVLRGAYDLLDRLGCRFLAPQLDHYKGSGEYIPQQKDLSVALEQSISIAPDLSLRKLYVEEGHSHSAANLKKMAEWMPKVGVNTLVIPTDYQGSGRVQWDKWREEVAPELKKRDLIIEVGGHGYQNFLHAKMEDGRLFAAHPEWFGMDNKGKRREAKSFVFCTSNPEATDYLTRNIVGYLKARPEIEIFDFWPPDGAKWCECPECAKLGTASNRQALLASHVMQNVKKVRPDVRFEILAYHTSVEPPTTATLDKSVLVDFCPISQRFDVQINEAEEKNEEYVKGLRAWREKFAGDISIYSYYRKYAWDSLPVIIPHYMQRDLKFYKTIPVQGISSYAEPGDWFTYELNHYALAHLGWNIETDIDALIKKYLDARYREAAPQAYKALESLARNVRTKGSVPFSTLKPAAEILEGQAKVKAAMDEMAKAREAVKDELVRHNIDRLLLMGEYAQKDLAGRALQAQGADQDTVTSHATELHTFLNGHADAGVFLVANNRLSLLRLQGHYGIARKKQPVEVPE